MARSKGTVKEVNHPETTEERDKALEVTTQEIEKKFGKGAIMRYGDDSASLEVEAIPTGSLALDAALGIGGVPRGRIVEIYGPESSGKTTLSLEILAEAQAMGGVVAFIDAEHALDPGYAARIGVDIDEVLISQPDTGERGGARAPCRDRGRDWRHHGWPPGASHEPGASQACRIALQVKHHVHLHQPASREDRRHVRQSRDHAGRSRAQVLLVRSHGHQAR